MSRLKSITREAFNKYGVVVEFSPCAEGNFEILVNELEASWRMAVYRYANKEITRTECHPDSMESFEPLDGATVLMVAENHCPQNWEVFFLDKPVCLDKGIWHQTLALTPNASVKITENSEVSTEFYDLPSPVTIGAVN
ncbi:MAG: ureidoglycolate lyase [Oscillospiraceae bacterium]|nr:ureidoglycolate lyase [Oscillospiraceae bacterium]